MRKSTLALQLTAIALFTTARMHAAPDTVDTNFAATAGQLFNPDQYGGISSVLVQPDGKILFGSNEMDAVLNRGLPGEQPIALPLTRFNPDGTVDSTFSADNEPNGSNAGIYYDGQGWPEVHALGLLSDGKIVAAGVMEGFRTGTVFNPGTTLVSNSIVRFNPDGTLDPSFQTRGTVAWPTGGLNYIEHVVIQPDDKIIALGGFSGFRDSLASPSVTRYGIARLNLDGSVDTSFQINPAEFGVPSGVSNLRGWFREASLDASGRLLVVGEFEWGPAYPPAGTARVLARLNPDGSRDASFNPTVPTNVASFQNVLVEPTGNITVVADIANSSTWMARFLPDGTQDPSFSLSPSLTYFSARPLEIDPAGRYLLATRGASSQLDRLVRILNDGSLDPDFEANSSYVNGPVGIGTGYFGTFTTAPSGKIYSGSFFDRVNGETTVKVVAFEGDFVPAAPGQIQFTNTSFTAAESSGVLRFAVTRTGGVAGPASATLALTHGTTSAADFGALLTSINFADGVGGTRYLEIPLTADGLAEPIETATLTLTNFTGATPGTRTSAALTLIDSDSAPIITQDPRSLFVPPGTPFTLTVGVISGATPVTYKWYRNGALIPGATLPIYAIAQADAALHGGSYTVEVTNPIGTTPSSPGIITVKNPAILGFTAPAATAIESDGTLTLTLQRGGSDVGAVSVDVTLVPGTATSPEDFIAATTTVSWANGDAADKSVVVTLTNDATPEPIETFQAILGNFSLDTAPGANTSTSITLLDDDSGPAITQPLVTRRVVNGWPATLSVAAQSQTVLSYQWFKNGNPMPGEESASLSFTPVTPADFAYYSVEVTNLAGTVTSGPIELGERPNPLTRIPLDLTVSSNQFTGITARSGGGYYIFGAFTSVSTSGGNVAAQRIMRTHPNGTIDTSFLLIPNGAVRRVVELPDGSIFASGDFSAIGVISTPGYMARILPDGTVDPAFIGNLPTGFGTINSIRLGPDGLIYVVHANGVDRLQPNGTYDPGFRANVLASFGQSNTYSDIAFGANGTCYLVGRYAVPNSGNRNVVKLNPNGTFDTTWKFTYGNAQSFTKIGIQPDGRLIVQGTSGTSLIRLFPDGSTDTSFTTITGAYNNTFAVAADGSIYIANGSSTTAKLRRHLPNGTLDTSFNNGTDPGANNTISSIIALSDGTLSIDGAFNSFNGVSTARPYLITGELRAIQITSQPASLTANPGDDASFTVLASSVLPLTYQWFKNGTLISGATLPSLTLDDVTTANNGAYTVAISAPSLATVTSAAAILTVRDAPAILATPQDRTLLAGQPLELAVDWVGIEPATFAWFRNGQPVPDQDTATLAIPSPTGADSGLYTLEITNALGDKTTIPIVVNIVPDPDSLAAGYIPATGSSSPNVLSIIPESGGAYVFFSGGITHPSGAYNFFFERIASNGNIREPHTSTPNNQIRNVVRNPENGDLYFYSPNFFIGGQGSFRIARTAADGTLDNTYTANGTAALASISLNPYSVALDADGRILVGGINQLLRLNIDGTLQANFSTSVSGLSFINQLEVLPDGKILVLGNSTMRRLMPDGTLDPTFTFPTLSGTPQFNHFSFDPAGNILLPDSFFSSQSIIRISPTGQVLQTIAFPNTTYNSISRILATPDGSILVAHNNGKRLLRLTTGGMIDPLFTIPGAGFNSSINALALADDGSIWVGGAFTQFNGATAHGVVRLNGTPLDIIITTQPADLTVDTGVSAQFSVSATSAAPFTYLWRKNGIPLTNGGDISGATSATLTLANSEQADAGTYDVVITNTTTGRPLVSSPASLLVLREPEILSLTGNQNLDVGQPLSLTVVTRGAGTLGYQWSRNGQNIIGANSATYQIPAVIEDNSGVYSVSVTNTYGTTPSAEVIVSVILPAGGIKFGTQNVSFASGVTTILPLPDGRTLVGGQFTTVNANSTTYQIDELALLDASGNLVTSFDLNPSGTVNALVLMPDGGVLVGGSFTQIGSINRARVARLTPSLAVDASWSVGTGPNNQVLSIDSSGSGYYLGGSFTSFNGDSSRASVCRIHADGSLDLDFTPPTLTAVNRVRRAGDGVMVGGGFVLNNPVASINQTGIVRLLASGAHDTSFRSSMQSSTTVYDMIALPDGKWLAGGSNGRLARFNADGTSDSSWLTTSNVEIRAFGLQRDGRILVGGNFTTIAGQSINRLARLNPSGTLDTSFEQGIGANAVVQTIAIDALGGIHIGGGFSTYRGEDRGRYARLNGSPLSIGIANQPAPLTVNPGQSATFQVTVLATDTISYQWRKNGVALSDSGDVTGTNTPVLTLANADDTDEAQYDVIVTHNGDNSFEISNPAPLVVLGAPELLVSPTAITTEVGLGATFRVSARGVDPLSYQWFRGSTELVDGPGISGATTTTLTLANLTVADSGSIKARVTNTLGFTETVPVSLLVQRLPAGRDRSVVLPVSVNTTINDILLFEDGGYLLGGAFTSVSHVNGSASRRYLVKFSATGVLDTTVPQINGNGAVETIARAADGKIYVAGSFTSINTGTGGNVARNRIARFNSNLTLDTTFNPAGTGPANTVRAILPLANGKILIAGDFNSVNSTAGTAYIALLDATGAVDTSFVSQAGTTVRDIASAGDGTIWVAHPNSWGGQSRIVRVDATGAIASGFAYTGTISADRISPQPDGSVISLGSNGIQKIESAGTIVNGWGGGGTYLSMSSPSVITPLADGRMYLGGNFTGINTIPRNRIAALTADGTLIPEFDPGSGLSGAPTRIRIDAAGRVWIVGSFTTYRGESVPNMVVLFGLDAVTADPYADYVATLPEGERDETADPDLDGVPNLIEFVFGTNPGSFGPAPAMTETSATGASLSPSLDPAKLYRIVEVETPKNTRGVELTLAASVDLTFTDAATATEFGVRTDNGTTETRRYYLTPAIGDAPALFWRLQGTR